MNHFQNLGKPFANNRFNTHSQQQSTPNSNLHLHPEKTLSAPHFNLPAFQLPRSQDLNNSSHKRIPSYSEYEILAKKVKRFQENISETNTEPLTIANPLRAAMRQEDIQSRITGQQASDSFGAFNQNLQKVQNSLTGFQQEGNIFGNNANFMDPATQMLMQQYMNKSKQEQILRENANSQSPLTMQNESFYPLIANNLALSNLFPNNISSNSQLPVEYLRLLEAQQTALQQIQLLINNQFVHNLQASSINPNIKGNNPLLPNAANMWMPPISGGNITHRSPLSNVPPTTLNSQNRQMKQNLNLSLHQGFKKCNSDSSIEESTARGIKIEVTNPIHEKIEEMIPIGAKKSEEFFGEEDLTQASSMKEEAGEYATSLGKQFLNARLIKKSKNIQQKEVFMAAIPKKAQDRKKNKWQQMKKEELAAQEGSGVNYGAKPDYNKRSSSVYRKIRVEEFAQNGETNTESQNFEPLSFGSVSQKIREKGTRGAGRKKASMKKNKLNGMSEERSSIWSQSNLENLTGNHNGISIMGSYGKNIDDLVMKEEEQRQFDTRVGEEFQTEVPELDLDQNISERKVLKMVWSPEIFDEETLSMYFAKLQGLLGCRGINEEKAIKMLGKKNMIQEDVIVTVKKNEKFYSNFLGTSSFSRDIKHKKNSEDSK